MVTAPDSPKLLSGNSRPYFVEEPAKRDARLKALFSALANSETGFLDTESVLKGIQSLTYQLPAQKRNEIVRKLVEKCDTSKDGVVDFDEFQAYVVEKEEELWNLFEQIDRSGDQVLQREEVKSALRKGGVAASDKEVDQFVQAMDQDGDGQIDFAEWRDYLLVSRVFTSVLEFSVNAILSATRPPLNSIRNFSFCRKRPPVSSKYFDTTIPPHSSIKMQTLLFHLPMRRRSTP